LRWPWAYIIYSTSIDTLELQTLVVDYNESENNYNITCGVVSDCSVPQLQSDLHVKTIYVFLLFKT